MQLVRSEEQELIRASALDWLAANYTFERRKGSLRKDGGSPAVWRAFAELGWLGLHLPEEWGGSAASLVEQGILANAMGRHLVVEPWLGCLAATRLLAAAGTTEQGRDWLPGAVRGKSRVILAHQEATSCRDPSAGLDTRLHRGPNGWRLSGSKRAVVGASWAARWVVSARLGDEERASLCLVDPLARGVHVDAYETPDGACAADIQLDEVAIAEGDLLGGHDTDQSPVLRLVAAESAVAACWRALGTMQTAVELSVSHVQQRQQFGKPLAHFQAVQHKVAEMTVQVVEAEAACELAAMRIERARGTDAEWASASEAAASATSKISRAARYVSQEAVQLHGAMGVCEEFPIASIFRTLLMFRAAAGGSAVPAQQYGQSVLRSSSFSISATLT